MASSPWTMIHSVVSSRSASLEKVSLPSMDRPPRAGGLTSSTTSLSRPMVTLSPATGTLRLGQVAGSDQLVGLANAPASCACAPAARKPERADKRSNERDSFRTASTPKRKKDPGILRPQRIARSWGIPHGTAAKAVPASHHSSVNPFLLATSAPPASFATDSIASFASDDDQPFEESHAASILPACRCHICICPASGACPGATGAGGRRPWTHRGFGDRAGGADGHCPPRAQSANLRHG